jgi:hypothetical protein
LPEAAALDPPPREALDVPDAATGAEATGVRDLETPPPELGATDEAGCPGIDGLGSDDVGIDGLGSEGAGTVGVRTVGVGTVGVGTVGVGTVGVGNDGVLTVGVGNGTDGVVTGGVAGVEGTVSDGTVSAALACPARGGPPSSARTSASSPTPNPQCVARRSQPPDSWPRRVAACRPLIALDIYPTLRDSNHPREQGFGARAECPAAERRRPGD